MPVGFVITCDGISIGHAVRANMRIVRGVDVGESQLTPRAATASLAVDELLNVEIGKSLVVTAPGGIAMFSGTVRDVQSAYDRDTNVPFHRVSCDGRISRVVGAGNRLQQWVHGRRICRRQR